MLYASLQDILALPDPTRLFVGHYYGTADRGIPTWESSVEEQRRHSVHIGGGVPKTAYIEKCTMRDTTLNEPNRMLHVLQMNLRAGQLQQAESNGERYLKIPLNKFLKGRG